MDKNGESYLKEIGTLEQDKEPEVVKFKVNVQARTLDHFVLGYV